VPRKQKAEASRIIQFVDELAASAWLGRRAAWPNHLYHYSDVHNVAGMLESGAILSRGQCGARGVEFVDIASQLIVPNTDWTHRYARLYFRPLTPTQFHQEGIRPPSRRRFKANCPVPVFLLFDSRSLLASEGCSYSNGNLASPGCLTSDSADFLESLPFKDIYHEGAIPPGPRKSEIIYHRCAEVLFQDQLELDALTAVVCRTGAERETLLDKLRGNGAGYRPLVRLEQPGERLFNRLWTYVESVVLDGDKVLIKLKTGSGEYTFHAHVRAKGWRQSYTWNDGQEGPLPAGGVRLNLPSATPRARVRIEIADCVAYDAIVNQQSVF
jgi:hypothetical protein